MDAQIRWFIGLSLFLGSFGAVVWPADATCEAVGSLKPASLEAQSRDAITGTATALDAQTLFFTEQSQRIRLWGVTVPALADWPEGPKARAALDAILHRFNPLRCQAVSDSNERPPAAVCEEADSPETDQLAGDPADELLRAGWAIENRAETRHASSRHLQELRRHYNLAEDEARVKLLGIWK